MEKNLLNIRRALSRLRDKDGLGGSEQDESIVPSFPNYLLLILYKIVEFQV